MTCKFFLIKYSLPILIIGVAAAQFFQVYAHHLTRWKGGGFGMYSEVHPKHRQVWVLKNDTAIRLFNRNKQPVQLVKSAYRLKFSPSQKRMETLAEKASRIYGADTLTIQIWEPYVKPATNQLGMKLIREKNYAKIP